MYPIASSTPITVKSIPSDTEHPIQPSTMVASSSKRRYTESEGKQKPPTEDLPIKRLKVAPGDSTSGPRDYETLERPAKPSMGPPPLPKASQNKKTGQGEGPGKRHTASTRTRYKTSVPSHLRLPSPALVRPLSQVTKSPSFILTPVLYPESTFLTVARSPETVPGWSAAPSTARTYTTTLQGPRWLPPATRLQGPIINQNPGVIRGLGGGRYPKGKGEDKQGDVNFAGLVTGKGSSTIPSHRDRIVLSSHDPSETYYSKCKIICEGSRERQRYFPAPKSVRRVWTWAGSSIPASQAADRKWNLPANRASDRPFSPFRKN